MGMQDPNKIGFGTIPNTDNFQPTPGQIHVTAPPLQAQTAQVDNTLSNTLNNEWNQGNQGLPQTQQPAGGFGGTWPQMNAPSAAPASIGAMTQFPMQQPMQQQPMQMPPMGFGGQVPMRQGDPQMLPQANPFLQRAFNQMPGRAPDGTANKYNQVEMMRDMQNRGLDYVNAKPAPRSGWQQLGDVALGLVRPGREYLKYRNTRDAADQAARIKGTTDLIDSFGKNAPVAVKGYQGDFNSNLQDYNTLGGTYGTGANNYMTNQTNRMGHDVTARGNDETLFGKMGETAVNADKNTIEAQKNKDMNEYQQGMLKNTAAQNEGTDRHNRASEENEKQKTINVNVQMGLTREEATKKWQNEQILSQQKIRTDQEKQQLERDKAEHERLKLGSLDIARYPGLDGKTPTEAPASFVTKSAFDNGVDFGQGVHDAFFPKQKIGPKITIPPLPSKIPEPIKRSSPNIEGALKQFHALPPDQQKAQASVFQQKTGLNPFEHVR